MRAGGSAQDRPDGPMAATVGSPTTYAETTAYSETTARPVGLRGERVMANRQHPAPFGGEPAQVRSCWMCGIRLPASQMVADGGSACHDVRWYCRDMWGCTRRWTSHSARLTAISPDVTEPWEAPGGQPAGLAAASPLPAISPVISLPFLSQRNCLCRRMGISGCAVYRCLASHSPARYFRTIHPRFSCAAA
jgi:hypothetical protein